MVSRIRIPLSAAIFSTLIIFGCTLLVSQMINNTSEETKGCEILVSQETRLCNSSSDITKNVEMYTSRARRLPQAIIIGARKSGTRALLKFLQLNSAIRAASHEIHYFDKSHNYKLGLDWYRMQMPESEIGDVTIEKSPSYFITMDAPERIKSMNSSIKLILILRDPVIRLISDYSQIVANKIETNKEEDEESSDDDSPLEYRDIISSKVNNLTKSPLWQKAEHEFPNFVFRPDGGVDDQRKAIKIGMYSVHLERWLSIFHKDQFHFVDGENLIRDPQLELHKIELFLNLRPQIRRESFSFNPRKGFFCIAPVDSANTTLNLTSNGYNLVGIQGVTCLSRSKGRRHVRVDRELIDKLQRFYAPYNEYLYSLTNINFNWSKAN